MRLLLVTPFVPHQRTGHGTATVARHVVEHFRNRHQLTVACFTFSPQEEALASTLRNEGLDIRTVPFPRSRLRAWSRRLASVALGLPYTIAMFDVPAMRQLIRGLLSQYPFDVVQFDTTFAGAYVDLVPTGTRRVLVEIDFTVKPLQRRYERERSMVKRHWYRRELQRMRRFEPALCRRFDQVLAVSAEDRHALEALDPTLRVGLLRYGADPGLFRIPLKGGAGVEVLFVGAFLHPPNVDALQWLCESILPSVRRAVPDVKVTCVGGNPPQHLRETAERSGVAMTGWVPDVAAYLARADVGVVPLRSGGGVKLKTLELMAAGRAVVTTPIGIEGIEARDGEHVLVADTAEAFAAHLVRLLQDDVLRARLAHNARSLALQDHQWTNNLRRLEEDYLELAHEPRRQPAYAE
jgi:glycosyltransferase involved in cell wall biosynthesis